MNSQRSLPKLCGTEQTAHSVVKGCQEETKRCRAREEFGAREETSGEPCPPFANAEALDSEKPLKTVHENELPRRQTSSGDNGDPVYLVYSVDIDRPLTGKPLRSGDLLLLSQEDKTFHPVSLTLYESGMLLWRRDTNSATQTFAWSPFCMVWAYRLTEVEEVATGHPPVLPFKVSIFHIGMGFIFAVDELAPDLTEEWSAEIIRAQWVADISRTLRRFTKSLFPPFQPIAEPVKTARWTHTRLLAGYMLLCKKDAVCVLYCELHTWEEESARFVAYEDHTCQHVVFTSLVGVQTLISERLASDCSCFVIDGHNFSTRTSHEKVLWLRVLANVKVKIRNKAGTPTAAELEECRISIQEKIQGLKNTDCWDVQTPLLPYNGDQAQIKREQLDESCGTDASDEVSSTLTGFRPPTPLYFEHDHKVVQKVDPQIWDMNGQGGSTPASSADPTPRQHNPGASSESECGFDYEEVEVSMPPAATLNATLQLKKNWRDMPSPRQAFSIGIAATSVRPMKLVRLEEVAAVRDDEALLPELSLLYRHEVLEETMGHCETVPGDEDDDEGVVPESILDKHEVLDPTMGTCEAMPCDVEGVILDSVLDRYVDLACEMGEENFLENDDVMAMNAHQVPVKPTGDTSSTPAPRCDFRQTPAQANVECAKVKQLSAFDARAESCVADRHPRCGPGPRLQPEVIICVPPAAADEHLPAAVGREGGDSSVRNTSSERTPEIAADKSHGGGDSSVRNSSSERSPQIAPDKSHRKQPPVIGCSNEQHSREAFSLPPIPKPIPTLELQSGTICRQISVNIDTSESRPPPARNCMREVTMKLLAWCRWQ